MNKYFNPRLLNAVIAGTGMKNPVRPHVVLGDQANGFIRGDLMDANAIVEIADQKIKELVNAAPEALDTLKELADALNDDSNFATTIVNAINQKQDTLISGENIKTINGSSILGEGNIVLDTSTYKGLPETWDTTHSMAELIASINADETAIPGKSYLGTVQLSDLPAGMVQAELIIDIMDQLDVDGSKVIVFSLSSADISPYKWEYTSAYGRTGAWRSWAIDANFATVATTGDYSDLINKPTIPDAQIQSDWNQADTTAKDYIKNKPTIPSVPDITAVNEALARANNVNATLNGTVVTITDSAGVSNSVDLAAATDERVYITISSDDDLMNVEGKTILVYYNQSQVVSATLTTDANGDAFVSIPNTTIYKIVFPDVAGYYTPPYVSHHAVVSQRVVEVEYKHIPNNDCEVTIEVYKKDDTVITKLDGRNVYITIGNNTTTYTTDANGQVVFNLTHGQTFSVAVDNLNNYYLATDPSGSYTATDLSLSILYFYLPFRSGLFIVASDGTEYAVDQWQTALANNTVVNSDAKLIKVATATLATNHGIFGIDIDEICSGNTLVKKTWSNPNNLAIESIPLNGNSTSAQFYYDGKSASALIQSEGDSRTIDTPAVDEAMNRTVTINGQTINGFLGSVGQYSVLQQNMSEIDGILHVVRPSATRYMSNITDSKWTSTQNSANYSYYWSTVANASNKGYSYIVLPFYPI